MEKKVFVKSRMEPSALMGVNINVKELITLLIAFVLVISLSACGNSNAEREADKEAKTVENIDQVTYEIILEALKQGYVVEEGLTTIKNGKIDSINPEILAENCRIDIGSRFENDYDYNVFGTIKTYDKYDKLCSTYEGGTSNELEFEIKVWESTSSHEWKGYVITLH